VLDLKLIRSEPEAVRAALARRGDEAGTDRVLELDARHRKLLTELEAIRAEQNRASKAIGEAKRSGADASATIAAMEDVARGGRELSDEENKVKAELDAALAPEPARTRRR